MTIEAWDEIRTAYHVARAGTVSGAAAELGVHHATVIRHIDSLEARLGTKLFQRHARGYTPTEAGADLLQVAQATDDQFTQLAGRLRGRGESVTGELVVTSLGGFAPLLVPALARFQAAHPEVVTRFLTGERLFRLEYGEAHVAIRAGRAPEEPDNVAQPLVKLQAGLYVAESYIDRRGDPRDGLAGHDFVGPEEGETGPPTYDWLRAEVPPERVIFRTNDLHTAAAAVQAGTGLGFLTPRQAAGLVEVIAPRPDWAAQIWLVTHVDLHRSAKVQALTKFLKETCREGEG